MGTNMMALLKKEFLEQWRTNKVLIIGLGFLFLGMQGPVLTKLLPELIKNSSSGLNGIKITVPPQTAVDALTTYFNGMSLLPALVLILLVMGAIAGERERGTLVFVLTKPVSRPGLVVSKFLAYLTTTVAALGLTTLAVGYYTVILFDANFQVGPYLGLSLELLSFMSLTVALVILCSTLFQSSVAAGGAAFLLYFVLTTGIKFVPGWKDFTPLAVFDAASDRQLLAGQASTTTVVLPTLIGVVVAAGLVGAACWVAGQREL